MADGHSKIDAAAAEASAEAAAKTIAAKLADKPASIIVEPQVVVPAKQAPAAAAAKAKPSAPKAATAPKQIPAKPLAQVPAPAVDEFVAAKPANTLKQLKDKIMENTTTQTADFTSKMRDTAADMQTRAKAAYDKGAELTADVTAFHKGNFDALVESGKVFAAGMQDLGRTAVEDARTAAESVTADVKAMAAVKSPTELLQLQGEIARRNLDAMVARTSKNAEVVMKLANDVFAPLSSRASVAMERLTKAA